MGRPRVLSDDDVTEARTLYASGAWTRLQLTAKYSVSHATIDAALGRGLKPRKAAGCCSRCRAVAEPGRKRCARHLADGREASKAYYDDKVKFWPRDMPRSVIDAWL